MGYGGLRLGTENTSLHDRSVQARTRAQALQGREKQGTITTRKKKAWEEEEHLRTLRDVRDLLARGPPVVRAAAAAAAAAASEESGSTEEEWQEREGGLRQRETLQQFSNWICEEKASKSAGGERCKDFGSFVTGSFQGNNGSEMCKKIYDRERERCKVTNGIDAKSLRNASKRASLNRNQSVISPIRI